MENLCRALSNYLLSHNYISAEQYNIYSYGIQMMFEHGLSILVSIIVIALFKMPLEGCLFFAIFIPLRSYLGGLHLKTYKSCFLLSLMTLLCILILVRLFTPAPWISFIILALSLSIILFQVYRDYKHAPEDSFPKQVCILLGLIIVISGIMYFTDHASAIFVISCTTALITISKFAEHFYTIIE